MKKTVRKVYDKIYTLIYLSRSPKVSKEDESFVTELRSEVVKIEFINTNNLSGAELEWTSNMNNIRSLILNSNPREFLYWEVIKYTMFVVRANYIRFELTSILKSRYYESLWKKALLESNVGRPLRYWLFPKSSGNLIHHIYHLDKFRESIDIDFNDLDFILEFGGGYGSMCRVFHNCNFNKKYVIFDLPVFSALQKFYLKCLGIKVLDSSDYFSSEKGVICISSVEELSQIVSHYSNSKSKLFVGTWSLSETPLELRASFVPLILTFNYYLMAYQKSFNEVDNVDFFNNFTASIPNGIWNNFEIEHLPYSYYLFGENK